MSPNLDFLRSYAVLVVLAAHLIQSFNNNRVEFGPFDHAHFGRWGVLVFFVHTSLVLMQSLERTPASGASLAAHFYTRRLFRLYPLSIVAVLVGVICQIPAMPHLAYEPMEARDLVSNLALTTNLTASPLVQVPLWSLPLEVQMYLLLPLVFWMTRWRGARWWMLLLWAGSVQAARMTRPHAVPALTLLQYVPCFLGGILAYTWMRHMGRRFPGWIWPIYILAVWLFYAYTPRDGWLACLMLGAGIPFFSEIGSRPINWTTARIAKYSYSIYLAHVPVIWLAFVQLRDLALWQQWIVLWATLAIASLVLYHAIEAPMIRIGSRLAERWFVPRPSPAIAAEKAVDVARTFS